MDAFEALYIYKIYAMSMDEIGELLDDGAVDLEKAVSVHEICEKCIENETDPKRLNALVLKIWNASATLKGSSGDETHKISAQCT